jgi:hypothetical protein
LCDKPKTQTSSTYASPSPNLPEFSTAALILEVVAVVVVTFCAVALALKKQHETAPHFDIQSFFYMWEIIIYSKRCQSVSVN